MDKMDLLRLAVRTKQQVTALYKGRSREFCPHILGTTKGAACCLAYQFGGESSGALVAGSADNWRCFRVDELSGITLRDGEWHTCAPRTGKSQKCVEFIEIETQ
jgi:hypothetical protein